MKTILIGLLISTNPAKSIAAFHVDGKLELRQLGQNVSDIGRLEWVEYGRAYIAKDWKTFVMRPGEEAPSELNRPKQYMYLNRKGDEVFMTETLREYLAGPNLPKVMMEAGSESVVVGGQIIGFRIFEIEPDSIFRMAGLEDEDIILAVNEISLTSALTAVRALMSLRNEPLFTVKLMRSGTLKTITVRVQ